MGVGLIAAVREQGDHILLPLPSSTPTPYVNPIVGRWVAAQREPEELTPPRVRHASIRVRWDGKRWQPKPTQNQARASAAEWAAETGWAYGEVGEDVLWEPLGEADAAAPPDDPLSLCPQPRSNDQEFEFLPAWTTIAANAVLGAEEWQAPEILPAVVLLRYVAHSLKEALRALSQGERGEKFLNKARRRLVAEISSADRLASEREERICCAREDWAQLVQRRVPTSGPKELSARLEKRFGKFVQSGQAPPPALRTSAALATRLLERLPSDAQRDAEAIRRVHEELVTRCEVYAGVRRDGSEAAAVFDLLQPQGWTPSEVARLWLRSRPEALTGHDEEEQARQREERLLATALSKRSGGTSRQG
jgi:hypothetical protein